MQSWRGSRDVTAVIVCAPDMTADVAARFGVEPCLLAVGSRTPKPHGSMKVLVDVGLSGAVRGVDAAAYIQLVRRLKPTWAVAPDVFGNFRATLTTWLRWAPTIAKYSQPIFAVQEFHRAKILDVILDLVRLRIVRRMALPMRRHPDTSCSLAPRLCAERAERALRALCGSAEHVHLLGPALRALRILRDALRQCERQGTAVSLDTVAYRRAPNSDIKRLLGGRWQPRNSQEAVAMLEAWLRQALSRP